MKYLYQALIIIFSFLICFGLKAQKVKFKKITDEEYERTSCDFYEDADAEYLYNSCDVYAIYNSVNGSVSYDYKYHYRIKIYSEDGYDEADRTIYLYTPKSDKGNQDRLVDLDAFTFNMDGGKEQRLKVEKDNIYKEQVNKNYSTVKFAMPAVKEGCILDIKYTVNVKRIGYIREFVFQKDIPVKKTLFTIQTPKQYVYNYKIKGLINLETKTNETVVRGLQIFQKDYSAENIPPLNYEPYTLSMDNYRGAISLELYQINPTSRPTINFTKKWDDIAELLYEDPDFGKQLKRKLKEYDDFIIALKDKSDEEKMIAILDEVQQNYTWNGFYGIISEKSTYKLMKEKKGNLGDINILLICLLKKAGIPAKPLVYQRRSDGFINVSYPTIYDLNYIIASVAKEDGSLIYLDASNKYLNVDELAQQGINLRGVVLDKKKGTPVDLINHNKGSIQEVVSLSIEDKQLKGKYKMRTYGYDAYLHRYRYKNEEDYKKAFEGENYSIKNVEVNDFDSKKMLEVNAEVSTNKEIQEIDGKLFINVLPIIGHIENPFTAPERKFAVFYDHTYKKNYTVLIDIPEGYKVESLPEPVTISAEDRVVTEIFNTKIAGNKIMITSSLTIPTTIISPTYYLSIKTLFEKLEAKTKEKIVLAKI